MNWHQPECTNLGFLGTIGRCIAGAEARHPGLIPGLRRANCLVAGSDYGGEHESARWVTYCFVVTQLEEVVRWVADTRPLRAKLLPDGRRIAFKRLGDRARRRALPSFLASANDLPGILICIGVRRRISSLFARGKLDRTHLEYEPLRSYPTHIAEKVLRVTHLLAFLIAGMSGENQDLLWLTDEDPIASTPERLGILTDVFGRAAAQLLPHRMRHLRVATARSDPGDQSIEDLLAIPDLVAGMLADVLGHLLGEHGPPPVGIFLTCPQHLPLKVKSLGDWFSDNTQQLNRLVVLIDETPSGALRATHLRFHGSGEIVP